jgi:ribosomal protein L7Ae-like RNA K-turn-binding protein
MNLVDKIVGMLGIAKRGKYTVVGDDIIFKIKKNKIRLIVIATDCPKNVDENLEQLALKYNATTIRIMTKVQLANAIGLQSVNAIGIENSSIARKIEELQQEVEDYVKKEQ